MLELLWAGCMGLAALLGWGLNLIGLPGNWVIVGSAVLYVLLGSAGERVSLSWMTVLCLAVLAMIGEVVEFSAGAAGAKKAGASRRGAMFALFGALLGGILGAMVGLPIPLVGPIIAALFFAAAGAMAGAMLGEGWIGRSWRVRWQVGKAAFWGRLWGTCGKIMVGAVMVAVVLVALVVK